MNVNNLCEDCIYRYNCPVNGYQGNAACLTVRKSIEEFKKEIKEKETVLNEMARIGKFDDLEVYVRTNDGGNIPHMHIWDSTTRGSRFHTCIRLDKAEYFHHTGKEDKLNSRQRKDLVNLLQAPYRRFNITNWERLLIEWNDNNSDIIIDENSPMPNYLDL